ncbi:MAG: hypothetical protein QXT93_01380, partial [Thermofilum sp.]
PGRVVPALEEKLAHPLHGFRHRVSGVERLASGEGRRELRARLGERVEKRSFKSFSASTAWVSTRGDCCGLFQLFSPGAHVQQVPSVAPAHGKLFTRGCIYSLSVRRWRVCVR